MAIKKKIAVFAFICAMAAPAFAEGMESNATSASQVNGAQPGIEMRELSSENIQLIIPRSSSRTDTILARACEFSRVIGVLETKPEADSLGSVTAKVIWEKGSETSHQTIAVDSTWLAGKAGQAVCFTEVYSLQGNRIVHVEHYQLLKDEDAELYKPYNVAYQRPDYAAQRTAKQSTFPPARQQVAANQGGYKMVGGRSKAERRQQRARQAAASGNTIVRTRTVNG